MGTLLRKSPHPIHKLFKLCGHSSLQVLGAVNPLVDPVNFDCNFQIVYTSPMAKFPRIYCPAESMMTVQVILFDRPYPARMQYLSLSPISLTIDDKSAQSGKTVSWSDGANAEEEKERARRTALIEKLRLHTVTSHLPTEKELSLPTVLRQINCSWEIAALLHKNIGVVGTRLKRSLSVSEQFVESATDLWDYISLTVRQLLVIWALPIINRIFILVLAVARVGAEIVLQILDWRLKAEHAAWKDVSATAQQLDIRLQQFCYWPIQYMTLRKRKDDWDSITNTHPEYIRFYNSLWLVANDVIIGIALGSFIVGNSDYVAYRIYDLLRRWSIEALQRTIFWLMDWPAGLKLNTELAYFLGDLFLWVIDYWSGTCSSPIMSLYLLTQRRRHYEPATCFAPSYPRSWIYLVRRSKHAYRFIVRLDVAPYFTCLCLLRRLCTHIQLAAHHHHFSVPPFPGQEA